MAREDWERDFLEVAEETGRRPFSARIAGVHPETVRYHMRRDPSFKARAEAALGVGRQKARFGAGLLALWLLAAPLAAVESDVFNLGSEGLSLGVTLLKWTEATGVWTSASAAGVDVVDEGDGNYSLADLPAATGTDRYAATIAATGDPDRGLAVYTYGASPGTRIVWQQEVELPAAPVQFKQGDTFGSLSMVVLRRLPEAACDPGTTATFTAANAQTGTALFSDRAADISDCELDATTGTYGATFTYDLQAGDTATVGRYLGEFEICYEVNSCQTLPADNRLRFEVVRRLGG